MNDYHTITLPQESPEALRTAVQCLRDGHVIALPTDTVYGLPRIPGRTRRFTVYTRLRNVL